MCRFFTEEVRPRLAGERRCPDRMLFDYNQSRKANLPQPLLQVGVPF